MPAMIYNDCSVYRFSFYFDVSFLMGLGILTFSSDVQSSCNVQLMLLSRFDLESSCVPFHSDYTILSQKFV
jgi:hypothetical protein